jgi:hypothetical protein
VHLQTTTSYSRRAMRRLIPLALALAAVAAGCNSEPAAYKPGPTGKCLRQKLNYEVISDPARLGIVERAAARGGLLVRHPGNAIRIAFGENGDDVPGLENGFRRFASKKLRPHIDDVMRTNKNVVFLWTVTPPQDEIDAVYGCLKG